MHHYKLHLSSNKNNNSIVSLDIDTSFVTNKLALNPFDKSTNVSNLKKSKNLVSSDVIYVLCCRCAKNTQKGSAKLYIPPLFP